MDTGLNGRSPLPKLDRRIVAEGGVPMQLIVEHVNLPQYILCRLFARVVLTMIDELALVRLEEALDTGFVQIVAPARQAPGKSCWRGRFTN